MLIYPFNRWTLVYLQNPIYHVLTLYYYLNKFQIQSGDSRYKAQFHVPIVKTLWLVTFPGSSAVLRSLCVASTGLKAVTRKEPGTKDFHMISLEFCWS